MIYWINSFRLFLALPIPYLQRVTLIAESSLALWLTVVGHFMAAAMMPGKHMVPQV